MLRGILAGLAAGGLWGLVFVTPRIVSGFSPVDVTVGRFLVYGLMAMLVVVLGWRRRRRPTWRQLATASGLSVLGFSGYYLLLVLAIRDAGTEVPALVIGTIPVWVMLLGKPQHLRWGALLPGLLLTLGGLGLMMHAAQVAQDALGATQPLAGVASPLNFWRGMALVSVALVFWTLFAILNSAWLARHPEVNATDWTSYLGLGTGMGALLLWAVAGTPLPVLMAQDGWYTFLLVSLLTGLGAAWLATILWNIASQRLSASLCGQLIVSETFFALLYSFAWDGQWPSSAQWLACVLFIFGIFASIRAHRIP